MFVQIAKTTQLSADFSGSFRLRRKSRLTSNDIVSKNICVFFLNFALVGEVGGVAAVQQTSPRQCACDIQSKRT